MFTPSILLPLALLLPLAAPPADAKEPPKRDPLAAAIGGIKLRSLGPAVTSGRVVGFAVHPRSPSHYFAAVASGGVWKTTNNGTTWTPVFDGEGSYSIGTVVLDPKNPDCVWVGTGENNSQRSVGYGDGVYRSDDGGATWKNLGLKNSEHIGKILFDPRDSNVVYVAAQGPLWSPGGDRGLFKTIDAGKTWNKVLNISENTGVTDVVMPDPATPDVLIAASYQRRRQVWTLINGGPESALHKSTDGGKTWRKLTRGLPDVEMGRIGFATAPTEPGTVYSIIEAGDKKGGIFRSTDHGETWEKRNDFDQQAQYYSHLVVDPKSAERIYVMGVYVQVSDDGGKTLRNLGDRWKHVDSHEIWIDPTDNDHYRVGCDGGIYESHDRAKSWHFHANLPVTQFYDVGIEEEGGPFYHIYGGTQDNFTLGGPVRTRSVHGVLNQDWFVVQGGDGFHCKVDPKDPNTVYGEAQYGVLTRFDRRTGQGTGIQPQTEAGAPALRWNWDSPLVVSGHKSGRLYFAAERVFRSDDRGDSWKAISGDLSRGLDRDKLEVMGRIWPADAVAKHVSTSPYGNITALAESPLQEGLLYAGTDDGLIQVKAGEAEWRKIDKFTGVPERTYVARIVPSRHAAETVYATFDNHKSGDFKPYLLKSTDAGQTWSEIAGDLPVRGSVLALAEDPVMPDLLFAGTEFGLFVTLDGGKHWTRMKGSLPTVAVRDLAIQRRQNDLVVATFGRGFYVIDDYSALRMLKPELLQQEGVILPIRDASLYIPTRQYGLRGKAFLGESLYAATNPAYGATFSYLLRDEIKTLKQRRRDAEKLPGAKYPSKDELRAEADEEAPTVLLTINDAAGHPVRTLQGPVTAGMQRVGWDLREPAPVLPAPRRLENDDDLFNEPSSGALVMPGKYRVTLAKRVDGVVTPLAGPVDFNVVVDGSQNVTAADLKALAEFQTKVTALARAANGALEAANDVAKRLEQIRRALDQTPSASDDLKTAVRACEKRTRAVLIALRGDAALRARNESTPSAIVERVGYIVETHRLSLAPPTGTQREAYKIASTELSEQLAKLRTLVDVDIRKLEKQLDQAGAPWTPGRLPEWSDK